VPAFPKALVKQGLVEEKIPQADYRRDQPQPAEISKSSSPRTKSEAGLCAHQAEDLGSKITPTESDIKAITRQKQGQVPDSGKARIRYALLDLTSSPDTPWLPDDS